MPTVYRRRSGEGAFLLYYFWRDANVDFRGLHLTSFRHFLLRLDWRVDRFFLHFFGMSGDRHGEESECRRCPSWGLKMGSLV